MTPVDFPEANCNYGPPPDLAESQCHTIRAYKGTVQQGSCDGVDIVVVAWLPNREDLLKLQQGGPVFLHVCGGLPPHYLSTDFNPNPA